MRSAQVRRGEERKRCAHLDDRDGLLGVVVTVQVEQRILVRGEEGEESAAVSAPDFDDPLRARLDARAEDPGSASGPRRIQDKERRFCRTSALRQSFNSGNSFCSHARSLKKLSFCADRYGPSASLSLKMLGRTGAHPCCARRTCPTGLPGRR